MVRNIQMASPCRLELFYANETASLDPPHRYTPWVTINGKVRHKASFTGTANHVALGTKFIQLLGPIILCCNHRN